MFKISKAVACALLVKKNFTAVAPAKPKLGCKNKSTTPCGANGTCETTGRCKCTAGYQGIKCEMTDAELTTKKAASKTAMGTFKTDSTSQDFSSDITTANMTKYVAALIALDPSSMEDADLK